MLMRRSPKHVGSQADGRPEPQDESETAEEVVGEMIKLQSLLRILQLVGPIFFPAEVSGLRGQALAEAGVVTLAEDAEVDLVCVEVELVPDFIEVFRCKKSPILKTGATTVRPTTTRRLTSFMQYCSH